MGDDSTPRTVVSISKQYRDIFEVIPSSGDKYNVGSEHLLRLKTSKGFVTRLKDRAISPFKARYIDKESLNESNKLFPTKEEA